MPRMPAFHPRDIPCPVKGCRRHFTNKNGLGNHLRTGHKVNPSPPPPWDEPAPNNFSPFQSRESYELADLIFHRNQMSKDEFNCLMQIWACTLSPDRDPPFQDLGGVPWQSFTVTFKETSDKEPDDAPWKAKSYDVWFRDPREILKLQLGNRDFAGEMDYAPKKVYDREKKKRRYQDFMSAQWAWDQANTYYPLYISNGFIMNAACRAHRNGVTLVGFLAIPKNWQYENCKEFREFRRDLYHASLVRHILEPLCSGMTKPETIRYRDGYYRRTIWGSGPYIADYLNRDDYGIIAGTWPFASNFPRADIHELISPDLLHQVIKGTFKDHLETYVGADTREILADIDRRIRAVPLFLGLRRFPEGRGYKQWTGDDSMALMKVYLPAIVNHVPEQMVKAIALFLRYFQEREIFRTTGFGAPNGLCSSITESKHIKAIRKPWRRSSRFNALSRMLLTNQRLDKLAACTVDFREHGMLDKSI
ncbi:hypothetical protein F5887DRAFT_1197461 [Amanita rubescens]|nr:hypothetical protein F5887DRAFT_1197461 [Amanita rubescens]